MTPTHIETREDPGTGPGTSTHHEGMGWRAGLDDLILGMTAKQEHMREEAARNWLCHKFGSAFDLLGSASEEDGWVLICRVLGTVKKVKEDQAKEKM